MGEAEADVSRLRIVLLPGMDGTADLREDLMTQLSRMRPVELIRYPEHQRLGYAGLTALVRPQLPAGRFVILGESFSGPIAIEIAATVPRVAGLVLASSFARRPVPAFLAPLAGRADPRWMPRRLIDGILFGGTGTPDQRARLHSVLSRLAADVLMLRAAEACRVDKRAQLAAVTCPVMGLHGTRDRLLPSRCFKEILHLQPNARVHHLEAAHMLLCTHAEAAARLIDGFCEEDCKAPPRHSNLANF
jgi:pimeloyl-[acyl-carrier protein] methyl ester esterase